MHRRVVSHLHSSIDTPRLPVPRSFEKSKWWFILNVARKWVSSATSPHIRLDGTARYRAFRWILRKVKEMAWKSWWRGRAIRGKLPLRRCEQGSLVLYEFRSDSLLVSLSSPSPVPTIWSTFVSSQTAVLTVSACITFTFFELASYSSFFWLKAPIKVIQSLMSKVRVEECTKLEAGMPTGSPDRRSHVSTCVIAIVLQRPSSILRGEKRT
jgi:hypothetical protein